MCIGVYRATVSWCRAARRRACSVCIRVHASCMSSRNALYFRVPSAGRFKWRAMGLVHFHGARLAGLKGLVDLLHSFGAKAGAQIGHAGRNADLPDVVRVAPSAIPFTAESPVPRALTVEEIPELVKSFGVAARRALESGFDVLKFTPHTVTCSMSSCRHWRTPVMTNTAVMPSVAIGSWVKSSRKLSLSGASAHCSCAFLAPITLKAATRQSRSLSTVAG